jgi:hypothetical protein
MDFGGWGLGWAQDGLRMGLNWHEIGAGDVLESKGTGLDGLLLACRHGVGDIFLWKRGNQDLDSSSVQRLL